MNNKTAKIESFSNHFEVPSERYSALNPSNLNSSFVTLGPASLFLDVITHRYIWKRGAGNGIAVDEEDTSSTR